MNRAERRRLEKRGQKAEQPKVYTLTQDQIDDLKQKAVDEATRTAFKMFMSIPLMVLHDKFGFWSHPGKPLHGLCTDLV